VSASNVEAVRHYIEHQPEHHAKHSFEDEFVSLLQRGDLPGSRSHPYRVSSLALRARANLP
jgi:hypothetical protein